MLRHPSDIVDKVFGHEGIEIDADAILRESIAAVEGVQ